MTPRRVGPVEVVEAVSALAGRDTGRTRFVAIDGFGAAGKTGLVARIADRVPAVDVVHIDDFAAPDVAEWDWPRFAAEIVAPLAAGRPARYGVQGWDQPLPVGTATLDPGRVLVAEGVSVTRRELAVAWDLTVWLDVPGDVRLARARARDGEALMPRWLDDWLPSEQRWAERDRPWQHVDLVVDELA